MTNHRPALPSAFRRSTLHFALCILHSAFILLVAPPFLSAAPFSPPGERPITSASGIRSLEGYDVSPLGDAVVYYGRSRTDTTITLGKFPVGGVSINDGICECGFSPAAEPYFVLEAKDQQLLVFPRGPARSWGRIVTESTDPSRIVFSPDGKTYAYRARGGIWERVVTSKRLGETYTTVTRPQFDPSGKNLYYLAKKGNGWLLVTNDKESAPYDSISDLILAPRTGKPIYKTWDKGRQYLVQGNRPGRAYAQITEVTFTPGDSLPAYLAADDTAWYVIEDTVVRVTEHTLQLHSLDYRADTREPAYVAVDDTRRSRVCIDGKRHSAYADDIPWLSLSPDGRDIAWLALDSTDTRLYLNRTPVALPGLPVSRLIFSPDGKHHAVVVAMGEDRGVCVVYDSTIGPEYDDISELQFTPNLSELVYFATKDSEQFLVYHDFEGNHFDAVGYLAFAPGTDLPVYMGIKGNQACRVIGAYPGKYYDDTGNLQFSPDGKTIAYAARLGDNFYWVVTPLPEQ